MKATDVIRRDHEAAKSLFNEFTTASPERRKELEIALLDALETHEKMEDTYFYPELKNMSNEDRLKDIEHEQAKLKAEVLAIRALPGDKAERLEKAMDTILAHAEREEHEIFPEAEKILDADRMEALGEEMEPESAVAKSGPDV